MKAVQSKRGSTNEVIFNLLRQGVDEGLDVANWWSIYLNWNVFWSSRSNQPNLVSRLFAYKHDVLKHASCFRFSNCLFLHIWQCDELGKNHVSQMWSHHVGFLNFGKALKWKFEWYVN